MQTFEVIGCRKNDGSECRVLIAAESTAAAIDEANSTGLLVESCQAVTVRSARGYPRLRGRLVVVGCALLVIGIAALTAYLVPNLRQDPQQEDQIDRAQQNAYGDDELGKLLTQLASNDPTGFIAVLDLRKFEDSKDPRIVKAYRDIAEHGNSAAKGFAAKELLDRFLASSAQQRDMKECDDLCRRLAEVAIDASATDSTRKTAVDNIAAVTRDMILKCRSGDDPVSLNKSVLVSVIANGVFPICEDIARNKGQWERERWSASEETNYRRLRTLEQMTQISDWLREDRDLRPLGEDVLRQMASPLP